MNTKEELQKFDVAQENLKNYLKLVEYPEWRYYKERVIEQIRYFTRQLINEEEIPRILRLQGIVRALQDMVSLPKDEIKNANQYIEFFKKLKKEG